MKWEKHISKFHTFFLSLKKIYNSSPKYFWLMMITNVLVSALCYIPGIINRSVLNMLQSGEQYETILTIILCTIPAAILIKSVDLLSSFLSLKQKNAFDQYINKEILDKNTRLDISCYDTPRYYDIIHDLTRSKRAYHRLINQSMRLISALLTLSINIVVITSCSSFIYVLIMFAFIVPAANLSSKYEIQMNQFEIDSRSIQRKISYYAKIMTGKNSAKEIRFYNLSEFFVRKYEDLSAEYRNGIKRINRKYGVVNSIAKTLPGIGMSIVLLVTANRVVSGDMLIGDFVFLLTTISGLQVHFSQIAFNFSTTEVNCHAMEKYEDYLSLPEIKSAGSVTLDEIKSIEFKNVSFSYPYTNEIVLNHIDFAINPKERTALVGVNGAGKTTIAKLLMRFYDVDDGEILINGKNIKEYELSSLRNRISPVFQNCVVYSLPLGFNLTLSFLYDDKKDKMKMAMFNAGLGDFLQEIRYDYNVELSKRFSNEGVVLSGGQNQRIAISRSLFRESQYYILDEPSAALDTIAESEILDQFSTSYKHNGLLLITHRLLNTELMDKIIVIEKGQIVEEGNSKALLMKNGRYRALLEMQTL